VALSPALLDVLAGAAHGETTEETARRRVVSPATVKTQRAVLLELTGARTLAPVVYAYARAGIL
jgi:DNA-binding NarL/FixJ family response regulator